MSRNGNGVFTLPSNTWNPAVSNTDIDPTDWNTTGADIATALTGSIAADGQTTITANLPMSTFRHTGVGNAAARTDYAAAGQVQDGSLNWVAAGGTADAITATYSPAITALVDGQLCYVRAAAANATTTPTFAPNGLTAHTITKRGGSALAIGDIPAALAEIILRYNLANTRWELLNPGSGSGTWTPADASGASLSFTSPVGYYRRSGDMVTVWGSLTYPSTANAAAMSIGGLPFTSANLTTHIGGFVGTGNFFGTNSSEGGAPFYFAVTKNSTTMVIRGSTSTQLTNAEMSTWTIDFTITYPI